MASGKDGIQADRYEVRTVSAVLALCFAGFALAVYVLGAHGEAWVNRLSSEIPDLDLKRGHNMADQGYNEEALYWYRRALDKHFANPQLKLWTAHSLGGLLLAEREFETAVEELEKYLALFPTDAMLLGQLSRAYRPLGNLPRALECEVLRYKYAVADNRSFAIEDAPRQIQHMLEYYGAISLPAETREALRPTLRELAAIFQDAGNTETAALLLGE